MALHRCPRVLDGVREPQIRCGRPVQFEKCGQITSTEGRVIFVRAFCPAGHRTHGPRELFAAPVIGDRDVA